MKLEQLVTSLEMGQKLVDAGFKAETPFWWIKESFMEGDKWEIELGSEWVADRCHLPAYTFAQLWEVLPEVSVLSAHTESIKIPYDQTGQLVRGAIFSYEHRSLPDTAAEAVLFCMENGYIKTDE